MNISSSVFKDGGAIPTRYTCAGANTNPPLTFQDVPHDTQALALVVDDPDAPGGMFDHWLLWNLPTSVTEIPENWQPEDGVGVGTNGFGKEAYGGPCPPSGTHHYHFTLYALDHKVEVAAGAQRPALEFGMKGHVLAQAKLIGTYKK
ncbi:MAG TPA: YbhB/YbcL family Raf kinase inhibitor-like protein [Candidatus Saccharimonadia bacterium]|nr:YbhB/YbcL family Raf kinase inhibitor-like protein [Candidatus Saccharimonadia bacterium]